MALPSDKPQTIFTNKADDNQTSNNIKIPNGYSPGPSGERKEGFFSENNLSSSEKVSSKEASQEVGEWVTKVETGEDIQLPKPITDDHGQVLVEPAAPSQVAVTLPLTDDQIKTGLHRKIVDSIRWLAEWCLRLLKVSNNKIAYKKKEQ